jgi:hypothetical protein
MPRYFFFCASLPPSLIGVRAPGELLGDQGVVELWKAGSAVLGRYGGVDEPKLVSGVEHVTREATLAITLRRNRRDALA